MELLEEHRCFEGRQQRWRHDSAVLNCAMTILIILLKILVFPGFLFLSVYSFVLQYLDRKLYARLQSRQGPPWYQPLADFFKLIGKETLIPAEANQAMFKVVPVFCLAAMSP